MNLEQPNTLDHQRISAELHIRPPPGSGEPRNYGWLWLMILVLVIAGVLYHFHSHSGPNNAPPPVLKGRAAGQGGKRSDSGGRRGGPKGDIGVYFTGLGAVTPDLYGHRQEPNRRIPDAGSV